MVFEILTFDFYLEQKKATVNGIWNSRVKKPSYGL